MPRFRINRNRSERDRRRCLKLKFEMTKVLTSLGKTRLLRSKGFYRQNKRVKIIWL